MPPEPNNYAEMVRHPHTERFKHAIITKLATLQKKQTWQIINPNYTIQAGKLPIPTKQVFKYKFDNKGFLTKYKARLYVKKDLQQIKQDIYAVMLAARIFRAFMAIVAAFNLETR